MIGHNVYYPSLALSAHLLHVLTHWESVHVRLALFSHLMACNAYLQIALSMQFLWGEAHNVCAWMATTWITKHVRKCQFAHLTQLGLSRSCSVFAVLPTNILLAMSANPALATKCGMWLNVCVRKRCIVLKEYAESVMWHQLTMVVIVCAITDTMVMLTNATSVILLAASVVGLQPTSASRVQTSPTC